MNYSIVNKQWWLDNEAAVLALVTIPNWKPTAIGDGIVGLRSVDVSSIAGVNVLILPVREEVAGEDRHESDEEYRLRIAGVANSTLRQVKAAGSIDAVVYYSEYDIRVLRGLDDWPIVQEAI